MGSEIESGDNAGSRTNAAQQRNGVFANFWEDIGKEASRLATRGSSEFANALFHEANTFVLYGEAQNRRDAASGHGSFDVTADSHGVHGNDGMENDHSREGRGGR